MQAAGEGSANARQEEDVATQGHHSLPESLLDIRFDFECPHCQSHVAPRRYDGFKTSGHSFNVLGDVDKLVLVSCPHGGEQYQIINESSRKLSKSVTAPAIGQRIQRPIPRERAQTISHPTTSRTVITHRQESTNQETSNTTSDDYNVRENTDDSARTTSTSDSANKTHLPPVSSTYMGLERLGNEAEARDTWTRLCKAKVKGARLCIKDAIITNQNIHVGTLIEPFNCHWESSHVSLELCPKHSLRRLKIQGKDTHILWLPETRVRVVAYGGSKLELHFSNCNNLQTPGPYPTQNQRRMSVTTYDPTKPNVELEIEFTSNNEADNFRASVLCKELKNDAAGDQFIRNTSQSTLIHSTYETDTTEQKPCIRIWKQELDQETNSTNEMHDMVAVSAKLDLDLSLANQQLCISLRYLDSLTYRPKVEAERLLWQVVRMQDGGPVRKSVEGAHRSTSKLDLVTWEGNGKHLIRKLLSKALSWTLQNMFLNIQLKTSSGRRSIWPRGKAYSAQLTIWVKEDSRRILIRTVDPATNKSDACSPYWISIKLSRDEVPELSGAKEKTITIKKVKCQTGEYLSANDLQPISDDSGDAVSDTKGLEFEFDDSAECRLFRSILEGGSSASDVQTTAGTGLHE